MREQHNDAVSIDFRSHGILKARKPLMRRERKDRLWKALVRKRNLWLSLEGLLELDKLS